MQNVYTASAFVCFEQGMFKAIGNCIGMENVRTCGNLTGLYFKPFTGILLHDSD